MYSSYLPKNWQKLRDWLQSDLGKYVLQQEANALSKTLRDLFGYKILILGEPEFCTITSDLKKIYKNINQFILHPVLSLADQLEFSDCIVARQDKLPIDSDSIDIVILPHSLETIINPHEVLRESYRVLRPEGKLIINGFTLFSIWGFWKLVAKYFLGTPWSNKFISTNKLLDWLIILGMEGFKLEKYCYALPINNQTILNKCLFLEKLGNVLPFKLGNIYTIQACKRVVTLTPAFVSKWTEEELNDNLIKPV